MQSWQSSRRHLRSLLQRCTPSSAAAQHQQAAWSLWNSSLGSADDGPCCSSAGLATSATPSARPEQQHQRDGHQGSRRQQGDGRQPQEQAGSTGLSLAQQQRLNLAMQNAPRKVFELIGDPRTGLADDVSSNPFGEITVDMVHHQESNEVYWYKYEFAGNMLQEPHRDARLSEQAKNLIYILRAKDPRRWTIESLARKFHVRQQRILAILALKEMEAHSMESGASLGGPLSAYACPVHLDDVHLDVATGEPLERQRSGQGTSASDACSVSQQLPQLRGMAQQVQVALLEALAPFGYSLQELKASLEAQVAAIEHKLQGAVPLDAKPSEGEAASSSSGSGDAESAGASGSGASAAAHVAASWLRIKGQLSAVVAAVDAVLAVSDVLQQEAALQSVGASLGAALRTTSGSEGDEGKVSGLLEGWEGPRLLRLVLALALPQRKQLLDAQQRVAIDLNGQGVDLEALCSNASYRAPSSSSSSASSSTSAPTGPLAYDVLGFRPVGDELLEKLVEGVEGLEAAMEGLRRLGQEAGVSAAPWTRRDGRGQASGGQGRAAKSGAAAGGEEASESGQAGAAPAITSVQLRQLLQLRRTYLSAEGMVASLHQQQRSAEQDDGWKRLKPEEAWQRMKLLQEADPSYPSRALKYEQVLALLEQGNTDLALMGLQELEGSEEKARAVLRALNPQSSSPNQPLEPGVPLQPGESVSPRQDNGLHKDSWELAAAFIDHRVAHKVYNRGSGERHVVRLPTFPTFEGYTLDQFDRADEGEMSQLNRKVARREEEQLYKRFQNNLVFNLGMVGPDLWDNSKPKPSPNLASTLDKPIVVYSIDSVGKTVYPPLKVVEPNGAERPLNDKETVYQDRRRVLRGIPYQLQRIRRKTEII